MKAMRILLVDDLPEASTVIANYLANMGMQVDACTRAARPRCSAWRPRWRRAGRTT